MNMNTNMNVDMITTNINIIMIIHINHNVSGFFLKGGAGLRIDGRSADATRKRASSAEALHSPVHEAPHRRHPPSQQHHRQASRAGLKAAQVSATLALLTPARPTNLAPQGRPLTGANTSPRPLQTTARENGQQMQGRFPSSQR